MTKPTIASLYTKWLDLHDAANAGSDEASDATAERRTDLERRIIGTPSKTLSDVIAKASILAKQIGGNWIHEKAFALVILADLRRLAQGGVE